jgi:hypothetical protein
VGETSHEKKKWPCLRICHALVFDIPTSRLLRKLALVQNIFETCRGTQLYDHGPDHVPQQQANSDTYELSVIGPKLGDRCLGLTFNRPTCRSFVVRSKETTITKETVACVYSASVFVGRYSRADSKTSKSAVFNIVTRIRQMGGDFLQYERVHGSKLESLRTRKVSSLLRDMLHTQYRSS